ATGNTYCFSGFSYDLSHNPFGQTPERCTVVPLDDRSLAISRGWARLGASGFFANTYTKSTQLGRSMTRTGIRARNIQLMVERCPTCSSIKIYLNKVLKSIYSIGSAYVL